MVAILKLAATLVALLAVDQAAALGRRGVKLSDESRKRVEALVKDPNSGVETTAYDVKI